MENIDLLICGAGPVGCAIARQAADILNWRVMIVEKRNHVGGNCYDEYHPSGVMIHRYGPHYFRTNNPSLLAFLSRFTEWIPGNYIVKSFTRGEHFPFPINLDTLEQFFKRSFTPETAQNFLESIAEKIAEPQNSEEFVLSRVGREMYEAFYKGYTIKQWDRHPAMLDASVCGRIPVRFNRDNRYVDHEFQVTPKEGFTALFKNMIDHPNISVLLQTDFQWLRTFIKPRFATVYSGPIDEYFGYRFGKLPWRSLEFNFQEFPQEFYQSCVQINYPNDFEYTRTVEIKHVTGQNICKTVVSYEYPRSIGDPYYPVPAKENEILYQKYRELAIKEELNSNVFFVGRLAAYRYYNTDQVLEEALQTFSKIAVTISK
jgi:UDP-galactopyranose mutase